MKRVLRWLADLDLEILTFLVTILLLVALSAFGVGVGVLAVVVALAAMGGFAALLGLVRRHFSDRDRDNRIDAVADLLTSVQLRFWWAEAARRGIIDPDSADGSVWRGSGGLFPVTASWPDGWPRHSDPDEALAGQDATLLVGELEKRRSRLTVLGMGGAGKTSAMVAVFLHTLRLRNAAPLEAKPPVPRNHSPLGCDGW
jgi:hypothetical protein